MYYNILLGEQRGAVFSPTLQPTFLIPSRAKIHQATCPVSGHDVASSVLPMIAI